MVSLVRPVRPRQRHAVERVGRKMLARAPASFTDWKVFQLLLGLSSADEVSTFRFVRVGLSATLRLPTARTFNPVRISGSTVFQSRWWSVPRDDGDGWI